MGVERELFFLLSFCRVLLPFPHELRELQRPALLPAGGWTGPDGRRFLHAERGEFLGDLDYASHPLSSTLRVTWAAATVNLLVARPFSTGSCSEWLDCLSGDANRNALRA